MVNENAGDNRKLRASNVRQAAKSFCRFGLADNFFSRTRLDWVDSRRAVGECSRAAFIRRADLRFFRLPVSSNSRTLASYRRCRVCGLLAVFRFLFRISARSGGLSFFSAA